MIGNLGTTEFFVVLLLSLAGAVLGLVLLWLAYGLLRRLENTPASWRPRRLLSTVAWSLLIVGIFIVVGLAAQLFFPLAWIVTAAVLIAGFRRYRYGEEQTLLWGLMVAAERGIPLQEAAEAFAAERPNQMGFRAALLADYLEAGLPLRIALDRSGHRIPQSVLLAADMGERTGTLGAALRQSVGESDEVENAARSLLETFFYLVFLMLFTGAMLTFLMVKIVPVFVKIMDDFGMRLPMLTIALIDISDQAVRLPLLSLPVLAAFILCVLIAMRYYVSRSARDLPLVRSLWWRADAALILRWLAIAVDRKRSMADSLRLLAGYFPRTSLRDKLARAAALADGGEHWCDSLLRNGLIRTRESAVLKAAERAGNLAWALQELAERNVKRTAWQMQAWLAVVFPVSILVAGGCVLFIVLAIFSPIVAAIQGIS